MHFILFALGLIGTVAGAGLIAINLPVDQVATGRVLVIAGVIAIAAGAILASLARVDRRLRELRELFEAPPVTPLPEEPEVKAKEVVATETPSAVEAPPAVVEAPPKPDVPAPPSAAPSAPAPPPATPPAKVASLGDVRPGAPPPASKPVPASEKTASVRPQPETAKPPPISPLAGAEPLLPSSIPLPPEPKVPDFDTVWANAAKAAQAARGEPPPPERETPPPPRAPAAPPPKAPADEFARAADDRTREVETVKIFKSGVIDGMAYALYTDGSIEADLPEGTVRFATVEDLRIYLDGAG